MVFLQCHLDGTTVFMYSPVVSKHYGRADFQDVTAPEEYLGETFQISFLLTIYLVSENVSMVCGLLSWNPCSSTTIGYITRVLVVQQDAVQTFLGQVQATIVINPPYHAILGVSNYGR